MADDQYDPCLSFDLPQLSGMERAQVLRNFFDKIQNFIQILRPYIDERTQFNPDYFRDAEWSALTETLQQNLVAKLPADERWISVADGVIRHIDDDGHPEAGHIHGLPGSYIEQVWDDLRGHLRKVSTKSLASELAVLLTTMGYPAQGQVRPAVAQANQVDAAGVVTVTVRIADDWAGAVTSEVDLTCFCPYELNRNYPNIRTGDVIPVLNDSAEQYDLIHVGMNDDPIGTIKAWDAAAIPAGWLAHATGRFLVGYDGVDYTPLGGTGGYTWHGQSENNHPDHCEHEHTYYAWDNITTKNVTVAAGGDHSVICSITWDIGGSCTTAEDHPLVHDGIVNNNGVNHTFGDTDNRPDFLVVHWIRRTT